MILDAAASPASVSIGSLFLAGIIPGFVAGGADAEPRHRPADTACRIAPVHSAAVGGIRVEDAVKSIWPFYGTLIAVLILLTLFPSISLWLPGLFSCPPRVSPAVLSGARNFSYPRYDRDQLTTGIVHLGTGAFHRAHEAACFDTLA
ncbi:hypothetical protein [Hyphomonas sp.]|uniref:hypothetical protein n=1 Tax=Hyphomonas sp. TaxID=87 RepID=UPI003918B5D0